MERRLKRVLRPGLFTAFLFVLVSGCATVDSRPRADQFPFHSTEGPYRLHWRLERESWAVQAVGFVEAPPAGGRDSEVVVELRGVSKRGRVLSRSFARTLDGQFSVQVRLRGEEDRFETLLAGIPQGYESR